MLDLYGVFTDEEIKVIRKQGANVALITFLCLLPVAPLFPLAVLQGDVQEDWQWVTLSVSCAVLWWNNVWSTLMPYHFNASARAVSRLVTRTPVWQEVRKDEPFDVADAYDGFQALVRAVTGFNE